MRKSQFSRGYDHKERGRFFANLPIGSTGPTFSDRLDDQSSIVDYEVVGPACGGTAVRRVFVFAIIGLATLLGGCVHDGVIANSI